MFQKFRMLSAALIVALMAGGLVSVGLAAPAQAADPPCITKAEFRKIKVGQSPKRVKHIVGSRGRITSTYSSDGYRAITREFKACRPFNKYSYVSVYFDNQNRRFRRVPMNVDSRSAFWMHN